MLTIQPIGIQQQNVKKVSFRGDDYANFDNKDTSDEYKNFADSFSELEQDIKTPKFIKPYLKVLRAISEGFVEFFAVSWTIRKSAKFTKIVAEKIAQGGIGKNTAKLFGYAKKGIQDVGKFIKKGFNFVNTSLQTNTKTQPIYENIAKKYSQLKENKFVKPVIDWGKNIIKNLKEKYAEITKKCKNNSDKFSFENIVDKIAKTLGFGSGAACVAADLIPSENKNSTGDED